MQKWFFMHFFISRIGFHIETTNIYPKVIAVTGTNVPRSSLRKSPPLKYAPHSSGGLFRWWLRPRGSLTFLYNPLHFSLARESAPLLPRAHIVAIPLNPPLGHTTPSIPLPGVHPLPSSPLGEPFTPFKISPSREYDNPLYLPYQGRSLKPHLSLRWQPSYFLPS